MYLKKVVLKNFRSFADTTIHFAKDLTVLVGENNAGKSNVLDALRLVLSATDNRQRLYPDEDDLRIQCDTFTIQTVFDELTEDQQGLFVTAIGDIVEGKAHYGYRYSLPEKDVRFHRPERWAGPCEGAEPEPEARQLIRHVYLPALRDAQRELASSRSDRISYLLRHFAESEEVIDDLEKTAAKSFTSVNDHPLIRDTSGKISKDLELITQGVQKHSAQLRFAPPSLRSLARDLRLHLLQHNVDPVDLSNCGLGYANLLYIACILVELEAAADVDLTVFLVEEPEAHLHPQLQAILLTYLRDKAEKSHAANKEIGVPAGRIQIIVATHSPNLTASVPIEDIVVLRRGSGQPTSQPVSPPASIEEATPPITPHSTAIPIARLGLKKQHRNKISRYLDVTKSALLFSPRILLVEGVSEALLLPVIAKYCVFDESEKEALARFHGSTLIPIEGVDFKPYVTLLLKEWEGYRIADLIVVLTDNDDGGRRVASLKRLGIDLNADGLLEVIPVPITLEAAIYDAGNAAVLRQAFNELHTRSEQDFDKIIKNFSDAEQGKAYADLLRKKKTRKGDHAHLLAERIAAHTPFKVPDCLEVAIRTMACTESKHDLPHI